MGHEVILVLLIFDSLFDGERVSVNIEDLQVFEAGFLISNSAKIRNDLFETSEFIVANGENIEFGAIL